MQVLEFLLQSGTMTTLDDLIDFFQERDEAIRKGKVSPPFTLPIDVNALILALIQSGKAKGFYVTDNQVIPPGIQLEYNFEVTPGYRATPIEFYAFPDPSNVISMLVYQDGNLFGYDPAMCQGLSYPIRFLKDYDVVEWTTSNFQIIFRNNGTENARIAFRFVYAEIEEKDYQKILNKYLDALKRWLLG